MFARINILFVRKIIRQVILDKEEHMTFNEHTLLSELSELFRLVGLGSSELRIYIIVLLRGTITAKELAREVNISPTKIYEPLNKLVRLGLLERTSDRPAKYIAVNPRIAWRKIRNYIDEKIRFFEERILPQIESLYRGGSGTYRVLIVPPQLIENSVREAILSSSTNIDIAISYAELLTLDIVNSIVEISDKVKVRLLIEEKLSTNELIEKLVSSGISLRFLNGMFGSGVIGGIVILIVKTRSGELMGIWSDHEFFTEIAKVYFDHLWSKAK